MSVDYYLITINGVISQSLPIGGGVNTAITTCAASGGRSAYCLAVPRDPATGLITAIYNFPINLSETYYRGADIEASYGFDMAELRSTLSGHTDFRVLVNYQPQAITVTNPGAPGTNQAGSGISRARVSGSASYSIGPFKASWQVNYSGPHHPGSAQTTPVYFADTIIPAVITNDLSLNYRFKAAGRNLQAFLTINNLFNQSPQLGPPTPTTIPGAQSPLGPGSISPLGRYFTGGVRFNF
jgi:hypothetical protein